MLILQIYWAYDTVWECYCTSLETNTSFPCKALKVFFFILSFQTIFIILNLFSYVILKQQTVKTITRVMLCVIHLISWLPCIAALLELFINYFYNLKISKAIVFHNESLICIYIYIYDTYILITTCIITYTINYILYIVCNIYYN